MNISIENIKKLLEISRKYDQNNLERHIFLLKLLEKAKAQQNNAE